jgi:microcystin-dependent protein
MEGTIANTMLFAGNFAPRSWALCQGQVLAISSHSPLYSLLGTFYGGDGRTTFKLPNLAGSTPIGTGRGPGRTPRSLGRSVGIEDTTLSMLEMPAHNHMVTVTQPGHVSIPVNTEDGGADEADPGAGVLANAGQDHYASAATVNAEYGGNSVPVTGLQVTTLITGAGQSFNNMQPSLAMNYVICLTGTYPSRS